ncbi:hypothetical protein [Pantoea anthophila]|uniref:hypothetical protein n=1 Tax=Pantoea anthophila TaxID=470931 RepID=UPI003018B0F0
MINAENIFHTAIARSSQPGLIEVPEKLLTIIEAQSNPIDALSDSYINNKFFEAINSQFSFIKLIRTNGKNLSNQEFEKLTCLFRWIKQEVTNWKNKNDPRRIKLVAIIVVVEFTLDKYFWVTAPNDFRPSDEMLAMLERMLASITMVFVTRGLDTHIWESEAVERFQEADINGDWVGIAQGWRLIEPQFLPVFTTKQACQCLDRFAPQRLVEAVSVLRQTSSIMSIVLSLSASSALHLGSKTINPHVQFAATYRATTIKNKREKLDEAAKFFLFEILKKVSIDIPRWAAWMSVFNFYPSQYPELQESLGYTLANADDTSLQAYIDSISLCGSGQDTRFTVADCLRSFRNKADIKKRRTLWCMAYQRWSLWGFGLGKSEESLTKIARCELDYALVGYTVECLDEAQRQCMLVSLTNELQTVEDAWYLGITDCISKWNAALSKMQPLILAMQISDTDGDWIDQVKTIRLPFDPHKEAYVILKYGEPRIF